MKKIKLVLNLATFLTGLCGGGNTGGFIKTKTNNS